MKRELTKGDVYVVVDTPKKAKKLKKVLEMFGEPMFSMPNNERSSHNGVDYGWGYGFSDGAWQGFNTKSSIHNGKEFKKVSIKQLRNILGKEHLKVGDYVVLKSGLIGKIISLFGNSEILVLDDENDKVTCLIEDFKRYATPEEIALLEPQQGLCSLCKSKLGIK